MKDSLLDFILEKPSTAAVAASFGFRPQVKLSSAVAKTVPTETLIL